VIKNSLKLFGKVVLFVLLFSSLSKAQTFVFLKFSPQNTKVSKVILENGTLNGRLIFKKLRINKPFKEYFLGSTTGELRLNLRVSSIFPKTNLTFPINLSCKLNNTNSLVIGYLIFYLKNGKLNVNLKCTSPAGFKGFNLILGRDEDHKVIWVIDKNKDAVVFVKPLNFEPLEIKKSSSGSIYVLGSRRLILIDPHNLEVESVIPIPALESATYFTLEKGNILVLSSFDKKLILIDGTDGSLLVQKWLNLTPIKSFFDPNSNEVFVLTKEGSVLVYDLNLNLISNFKLSGYPVALTRDDEKLYVGDSLGWISIYDVNNFELIRKLKVCNEVEDLKKLNQDTVLVLCKKGTLVFLNTNNDLLFQRVHYPYDFCSFVVDGTSGDVYISTFNKKVLVIDSLGTQKKAEIPVGGVINEMVSLP